jgi:hypothetical protein
MALSDNMVAFWSLKNTRNDSHSNALALHRPGAAMVYARAFAVGVVTGVLALIVAGAASIVWFLMTAFFGGLAATGGGGIGGISVGIAFPMNISPKPILMQMAVGFAIGFLFTLWRYLVTKHGTC